MYNRNNPLLYPVKPLPVIEGIRACRLPEQREGSLIPHLPDVGGKGVEQAASWDTVDCPKQYEKRMANQKQVLDVQVSKGITTAQSNEHLRDRSEKRQRSTL